MSVARWTAQYLGGWLKGLAIALWELPELMTDVGLYHAETGKWPWQSTPEDFAEWMEQNDLW